MLNPFESAFRPTTRIKTQDRLKAPAESVASEEQNEETTPTPVPLSAPKIHSQAYPIDLKERSQQYEIDMIRQALEDSQFNQKKTAEKLSLTYHQLRGYLKKYNLLDSSAESAEA